MKKIIGFILISISILAANDIDSQKIEISDGNRPKIGLVLSGGGAKGFAHLGVLKILEKNNIPIDYITGTSIGALIGTLYSAGYPTSEIEEIIKNMDTSIFTADRIKREDLPMEEKLFSERYSFSIPLKDYKISLPQSLIPGQSVYMILKKYLWEARKIRNFDDLPIPIHILTTNINTGEEVVLTKGDLVKALSASMALPAFFHPIKWEDDMVLSDGLSSNNFPVEEVRKMGADIVIGVNISASLEKMEDLNFITVLNQIQYFRSYDRTKLQREKVDILIEPNTKSYFPLDFERGKELINLGEEEALKRIDDIKNMISNTSDTNKKSLINPKDIVEKAYVKKIEIHGLNSIDKSFVTNIIKRKLPFFISKEEMEEIIKRLYAFTFFERIFYEFIGDTLIFTFEEKTMDKLNLGFNYKNINGSNYGKFILGLNLNGLGIDNNKTNIDLTVAALPRFTIRDYLYYGKGIFGKIGLLSTFNYEKKNHYLSSLEKYPFSSYNQYDLDFLVGSITGKRNLVGLGLRFENINYDINNETIKDEKNIDYYVKWTYDSYDKTVFPNKGTFLKYTWNIDFENLFQDDKLYNQVNIYLSNYTPISKWFSLISAYNLAYVTGNDIPFSKYPQIKGMVENGQDFSFYGLDFKGIKTQNNALFQFGGKINLNENLFISAITNGGVYTDLNDKVNNLGGVGISLGANTDLGPISLNYSRWNKDYNIYFNFGYEF